jgi:hypothetical protein
MNRSRFIAAIAIALTAGTAFVQSAFAADDYQPKTRAQVYAELEQARADGSFYSLGEGTPRRLTRARLAAPEAQAKRAGADAPDARAAGQPAPTSQRAS